MKAIKVSVLPASNTQPTRLKACTDEKINKSLTVSEGSYSFFPEKIACCELQDQAQFLAEQYLIKLGWDTAQKYRLACASFKGDYYFTMILK